MICVNISKKDFPTKDYFNSFNENQSCEKIYEYVSNQFDV